MRGDSSRHCIPRRLTDVERAVRGSPKNEQTAERAGALAVRGAKPLNYNHFKIPLMENLVKMGREQGAVNSALCDF